MFRVLKIILLLILLSLSVLATAGNLEIKFPNILKKEVDPGANINVLIKITNQGDTDEDFQIRINNNNGSFKLISDCSSIQIEKNSSINKIIGIQISNTIKAGSFSIELEALENPDSQSFGKLEIPINVKPKYEININKLKAPQSLFSGDTASVYYLIQNLSNIDVSVKTTAIFGLQTKVSTLNIPKDSSVISHFLVRIPNNIVGYSQQTTIVIAELADKPETEKTVTYSFDVFPIKNVKFDRFNRFPVKVGAVAIVNSEAGNLSPGFYNTSVLYSDENNHKKLNHSHLLLFDNIHQNK